MIPRQRRELWLWGLMGAGKSTVGRAVAARRGLPFVDVDGWIEERTGRTISDMFAEGEAVFRAAERAALDDLLADGAARVVALGGGALVDPEVRTRALARVFVVTLTIDAVTAAARAAEGRPLLTGDAEAKAQAILKARRHAYASAHLTVDATASVGAVAEAVLAAWG